MLSVQSNLVSLETLRRMRAVEGEMSGLCEACGHTDCQRVTEVMVGKGDYMMVCPSCHLLAEIAGE